MNAPVPTFQSLTLQDQIAGFTARPGARAPGTLAILLLLAGAVSLGVWAATSIRYALLAAALAAPAFLFAFTMWLVARRSHYTLRIDFAAGQLQVIDVRGLNPPACWSGPLSELAAISISPGAGDATHIRFVWKAQATPPLTASLAHRSTMVEDLHRFRRLAAAAGFSIPPPPNAASDA